MVTKRQMIEAWDKVIRDEVIRDEVCFGHIPTVYEDLNNWLSALPDDEPEQKAHQTVDQVPEWEKEFDKIECNGWSLLPKIKILIKDFIKSEFKKMAEEIKKEYDKYFPPAISSLDIRPKARLLMTECNNNCGLNPNEAVGPECDECKWNNIKYSVIESSDPGSKATAEEMITELNRLRKENELLKEVAKAAAFALARWCTVDPIGDDNEIPESQQMLPSMHGIEIALKAAGVI